MNNSGKFRITTLSAAVASTLISGYTTAQEALLEEVIVTATRRAESIQDIPINITALSSNLIERERLSNLSDIARRVPGLTVVDQGPRSGNILTVRGLNVDSLGATETTVGNSGGDTVGTYLGEIPVYVDLKLNDMERIEVLIGPQGTLYGAGTLGGAVRYIPNRPDPDGMSLEVRGDVYDLNKSGDLGYETGATLNLPIIDGRLALRASIDYEDDPGFIDYDYLVREAGVSNPQPDLNNPEERRANLKRKDDVNDAEITSGRLALRYVGDRLDGNLTYYYQKAEIGGRQVNHSDSFGTGDYVAAHRFEEPIDRKNELLSLELVVDLGFAELTSATGYSEYNENGNRDQTDLLLSFEYGYELFPSFSSFTREDQNEDRFNQELRLVSTGDGPLNWIVGGFYNDYEVDQINREWTPNFDKFAVAELGGVQLRPDALEYYEVLEDDLEERAVFGELGYHVTDDWQVTIGARWFKFENDATQGFDLPLLETTFFGRTPVDLIDPFLQQNDVDDDDVILKFNTSYHFTDEIMAYFTVSEGYRLGGLNSVPPCTDLVEGEQNVCALPDEILIESDTTVNYELGWHTQWGDNLIFNGALFFIDWDDIQIADFTQNGSIPIISNGGTAESMGVELSTQWYLTDNFSLMGSYAYTNAELTEDAPGLVDGEDAFDGDRLAGTPEHQVYAAANYAIPLEGGSQVELDYSMTFTSDVYTRVGLRANGEELSSFALHNVSATWFKDAWRVTLYADNVFDKYAETGVRNDESFIRQVGDFDLRRYYHNVIRPRQVGMRFVYNFDG